MGNSGRCRALALCVVGFVLLVTPAVSLAVSPSRPDLAWSTFFGGSEGNVDEEWWNGDDYGCGIAVDGEGNAYVTGDTYSTDFPTPNGWDTTYNGGLGGADVFVSKFTNDGAVVWSTYLGGSDWDGGSGIAVDGAGDVYVTGQTDSSDFPVQNGWDTSYNGDSDYGVGDAFVTKFTSDGALVWSTFLGGSGSDGGRSIAVDGAGNAYVTGFTLSSDFPVQNGWDTTYNGGGDYDGDAFVAKFSPSGSLVWSTYLGGSDWDGASGIAVDGVGDVYVTGQTDSSDFPVQNGWDATYNGRDDAFVTKFTSDGSLVWSTYLGGSGDDEGRGIAVNGSGNVYVTGETGSSDFPVQNGWDTSYNGGVSYWGDGFVAKFTASGSLVWSTYLGGSRTDWGHSIAVDGAGNAYVTGCTGSCDFPAQNGWDTIYNGDRDAFVAKFTEGSGWPLQVKSSPITGVTVAGSPAGTTNYDWVCVENSLVTLRAASAAAGNYAFTEWVANGIDGPHGKTTLRFTITQDSTATAKYKSFRSLRISGPTRLYGGTWGRYYCRLCCTDGSTYTISPYVSWSENSRYAKFVSPGILRTSRVPSDQRCRITVRYAGRSKSVYMTIRHR